MHAHRLRLHIRWYVMFRLCRGTRLLLLRPVQVRWFGCPSLVRESGQVFYLFLSEDFGLLLFDRGGLFADVAEPLMPLCWRVLAWNSRIL